MSSTTSKNNKKISSAQASSAQTQARQIKALEPYETKLGISQLKADQAVADLPIWATGRDRAVPLYNQLPTNYQNIDANNAEVQKYQNMFDNESVNWAKNQTRTNQQSDAANKTYGSSYSASRDASLENQLAQQKSSNLIQAMNTVGGQYSTNMNNLTNLIGTYLGSGGGDSTYNPISFMSAGSGNNNSSLNSLLASLGSSLG